MSEYLKGLIITVIGVLVITPDSLLIRLIEADSWTVIFWRNSLSGLAILLGLLVYYRRGFCVQFGGHCNYRLGKHGRG